MKKTNLLLKKSASLFLALVLGGVSAFADEIPFMNQSQKEQVANGFTSFTSAIVEAVPTAAAQQNLWSDAYIGTLIPDFKFGAGVTLGGSRLDITGFKSAASSIPNVSFSSFPDTIFMPALSVDVRLGGIALPFDIGLCAMITNPTLSRVDFSNASSFTQMSNAMTFNRKGVDISLNYMAVGADFRYNIYSGFMDYSLGVGYFHITGLISTNQKSTGTASVAPYGDVNYDQNVNMGLSYVTDAFTLQAQCSKEIAFVTLFGGFKGIISHTSSTWGYDVSGSSVSVPGLSLSESDGGTIESSINWFENFQPNLYLGCSFNFFLFQITASVGSEVSTIIPAIAAKDYRMFNWSGALSVHVKI